MKEHEIVEQIDLEVRRFLAEREIRKVVVGVSGGADSVALLVSLFRNGIDVVVANCNFHLRGEESDRDSKFVADLCHRLSLPLFSLDFEVKEYISQHGGSVEMACRELRYREFFNIMQKTGADRVAVAHNSDDRVETVLLNLFRGAGVKGLRGMQADTGKVVRPLLGISRCRIEAYLEALGERFIVDSSNRESIYRRNFIRNELLPLIETRWAQVRSSILKTAEIMDKEEKALVYLQESLIDNADILSKELLDSAFDREWPVRRFVINHGGKEELASEIVKGLEGKEWQPGRKWISDRGEFILTHHGLEWVASDTYASYQKNWIIEKYENSETLMKRIISEKDNKILWSPIPPEELEFRRPAHGDRIRPLGMKGSRLVSDIISDAKLSALQKKSLYLAVSKLDGEVIWVEGLKRSRMALIKPENKIVWRIVGNLE